jgi:hypothetical protein
VGEVKGLNRMSLVAVGEVALKNDTNLKDRLAHHNIDNN